VSDWSLRLASDEDIPALEALIPISVRALQSGGYSSEQMEAALGSVFGVDRQLIRDETYFVVEIGAANSREPGTSDRRGGAPPSIIGCGGWSKRKTLFGSDHQTNRDDALLDPKQDAARIRAFFVHPDWARRGIATAILNECETAIRAAHFHSIELAATLTGIPFYAAFNYRTHERSEVLLSNGLTLAVIRMTKQLP
jgi:ribosomal protein S18 acetylase RimI-like enzyme